ncbi:Ribosome-recycling factor [Lachnellula hyalina]|uniref:Ribosome-recycling factor n=1 Tax=Lachnellula hyalina TaxID=1316788 RepID=A0A8H8U366_9HELO|nr:Ribosome-recycling factor [Lachnellula hyalina]TVY29981.1 Ribosome-recycling factor [Lachnellula hyalina]
MPPPFSIRANALKQLISKTAIKSEAPIILRTTTTIRQPFLRTSKPALNGTRTFSQSHLLLAKKKSKADRELEEAASVNQVIEDPFDFSELNSGIEKALKKLEADLSKLRTGGRFNPEVLDNLRVSLSKESKKTERLGDLANVLPNGGRMLMVLVGEKEHLHPVMSAIQAAKNINLQPQIDPQNSSTQLNIRIPPPTKESRDQALADASKTGETAKAGVQTARSVQHKRLRGMELKKAARPDDLKKAQKEMEKIVEKATADIKKTVDTARKTMAQS